MVPYFYLVCAGAVSLSAPIDPLEKFDETMKKMDWSHLVPPMLPEKDADGPATSTGAPVMPTPAAILNSLTQLDGSASSTTAFPPALPSDAPVADVLSALHQQISDVHSSVHNVLKDSLSHPGIQPSVESLGLGQHLEDEASSDEDATASEGKLDDSEDKADDSEGKNDDTEDKTGDSEDKTEEKTADAEEHKTGDSEEKSGELTDAQENAMQGMQKLMGAAKMIAMLEPMLEPLRRKLTLSMEHLSPEDREKAERVLDHIKALDAYARVTASLMAKMAAAQDGSAADREKAVTGLIVGVKMLQDKVAEHMRAMKDETQELNEGAVIVDSAPKKKGPSVMEHLRKGKGKQAMDKMALLLVKLGKKIAAEIKDPANKHNPKVLLDIKLFLAVKDSVEKTKAVLRAGNAAIKKATTEEEKATVKAAVKKGMQRVEAALKTKMMALQKEALMVATLQARKDLVTGRAKDSGKAEEEDAGSSESEDADSAEAEKPKKRAPKAADDADEADDAGDSKKGAEKPTKKGGAEKPVKAEEQEDVEFKTYGDETWKRSRRPSQKVADDDDDDADDDAAPAPPRRHRKPAAPQPKPADPATAAAEAAAKKDHPDISEADIEHIFADAADEATANTKAEPTPDDAPHLRTH